MTKTDTNTRYIVKPHGRGWEVYDTSTGASTVYIGDEFISSDGSKLDSRRMAMHVASARNGNYNG